MNSKSTTIHIVFEFNWRTREKALVILSIVLLLMTSFTVASSATGMSLSLAGGNHQGVAYQGRVSAGGAPFTGQGQFKFAVVSADGSKAYWTNVR